MAKVPSNDGLDWGLFPTAAELPNVSGSSTQNADLVVGARAYAADSGAYVCSVAAVGAATWVTAGTGTDAADINYTPTTPADWPNPDPTDVQTGLDSLASQVAALPTGGSFATIDGFTVTTAATQTDAQLSFAGIAGAGSVPASSGSVTGLAVYAFPAPTGGDITVRVTVGGVNQAATEIVLAAAGPGAGFVTIAPATVAFGALDVIAVNYDSDRTLSNTPVLLASVQVAYDA